MLVVDDDDNGHSPKIGLIGDRATSIQRTRSKRLDCVSMSHDSFWAPLRDTREPIDGDDEQVAGGDRRVSADVDDNQTAAAVETLATTRFDSTRSTIAF